MKKLILVIGILFVAASCTSHNQPAPLSTVSVYHYDHQIQVGGEKLVVEIADTPAAQELGLSNRPSMNQDEGMLFKFGAPIVPKFWMKDMRFSLDFIWIANNKIILITKNAPAPLPNASLQSLPLYSAPSAVDEVLEVNSGWSDAHQIQIGDDVTL